MIRIMDNKGIHFVFENGITLSIQIGAGNYCDNRDESFFKVKEQSRTISKDAEIAAWTKDKVWFNWDTEKFGDCTFENQVKGYVKSDDVFGWIQFFKNYKREK